jgi:flagellar protein FliO/FliZ
MFDLFGSELPLAARFFIAFLVVLALIGLTAWLVRRFGASRLGGSAPGRQPRLAVIDAASVDGRRRLVLIRRDNIEHLLMIGGPTDVVVEQNIVRAAAAREMPREPARPAPLEPAARTAPIPETVWPLQPSTEPPPVAPPRPYRAPATDEPWLPHEPGARARPADSLTGLATAPEPELAPPPPPVARTGPPPTTPAPAEPPPPTAQTDRNLAEMAQQLEAALRRTPAQEGRPPVTDPLVQPPAKPETPPRDFRLRAESKFEPRPEPKAEPRFEPKFETKPESRFEPRPDLKTEHKPEPKFEYRPEPKHEPPAGGPKSAEIDDKNLYDNLEEEMASLLGRPTGKT